MGPPLLRQAGRWLHRPGLCSRPRLGLVFTSRLTKEGRVRNGEASYMLVRSAVGQFMLSLIFSGTLGLCHPFGASVRYSTASASGRCSSGKVMRSGL